MRSFLKRLVVIFVMLLAGAGVARAGSTEIRSTISAVRIIIVDDQDTITHVYQNTDQEIIPEVRRNATDGLIVAYTPKIAEQDQAYRQQLPSLIQTLYAML